MNSFQGKWKHMLTVHPDEFVRRILPFVLNPEKARDVGRFMAEQFKERLMR